MTRAAEFRLERLRREGGGERYGKQTRANETPSTAVSRPLPTAPVCTRLVPRVCCQQMTNALRLSAQTSSETGTSKVQTRSAWRDEGVGRGKGRASEQPHRHAYPREQRLLDVAPVVSLIEVAHRRRSHMSTAKLWSHGFAQMRAHDRAISLLAGRKRAEPEERRGEAREHRHDDPLPDLVPELVPEVLLHLRRSLHEMCVGAERRLR